MEFIFQILKNTYYIFGLLYSIYYIYWTIDPVKFSSAKSKHKRLKDSNTSKDVSDYSDGYRSSIVTYEIPTSLFPVWVFIGFFSVTGWICIFRFIIGSMFLKPMKVIFKSDDKKTNILGWISTILNVVMIALMINNTYFIKLDLGLF